LVLGAAVRALLPEAAPQFFNLRLAWTKPYPRCGFSPMVQPAGSGEEGRKDKVHRRGMLAQIGVVTIMESSQ
jgi:hypothetical protein